MFKVLEGLRRSVASTRGTRLGHSRALIAGTILLSTLSACQTAGPSRGSIEKAGARATVPGLHVVDVTQQVARQLNAGSTEPTDVFAHDLGGAKPVGTTVGVGDTVDVTIYEASPPALFGMANLDPAVGSLTSGSQPNALPGFLVGPTGTITIPFAGEIPAAGHTVHEIEQEIVRRLQGRAHLPQAIVRISHNVTSTVTVLGDVKQPSQIPLTPHGERVLDAISAAGGTNDPLDRVTIQLTRGDIVRQMPAREVIADPRNNVVLKSGDVITTLFQAHSFTVLGAAGKNEEIPFEAMGITLSQALGRVGGLEDSRADPKGVFIFRWEKPEPGNSVPQTDSGTLPGIPTIYRVDMKRPETYLAAQKFEMRDGDLLYVSTSPTSDFQNFVRFIASSILPVATVRNIAR